MAPPPKKRETQQIRLLVSSEGVLPRPPATAINMIDSNIVTIIDFIEVTSDEQFVRHRRLRLHQSTTPFEPVLSQAAMQSQQVQSI